MVKIKKIFRFSMGNYIAGFLGALPTILFPLIITHILSPKITAYFFISWTIGFIFFQISHAISVSLLVEGSHNPKEFQENLKKAALFNALIFLPLIFIFVYFGDWILQFFGPDYSTFGFDLLRVLAIVSPLVAISNIYLSAMRIKKDLSQIITISGIIGIGTLTLGSVLLQMWGLVGIGIAWGLNHTFALIFIIIKKFGIRY
jgi:O-antigen/teichoic acid export membrane protein